MGGFGPDLRILLPEDYKMRMAREYVCLIDDKGPKGMLRVTTNNLLVGLSADEALRLAQLAH